MNLTNLNKSYSELMELGTFEERFNYLKLNGRVGDETFGHDRYLNQLLYKMNPKWKAVRKKIIIRDNGCDLGVEGYDIYDKAIVHHINPITSEDILNENPIIFDPENLITTTHLTHNAIHYSDDSIIIKGPITRSKNDTCPWKN
jgi:hypothetical protein